MRNNVVFFLLALLLPAIIFAQGQKMEKGIAISVGFHQTNSKGLLRTDYSDEPIYPMKQSSAVFFDVNVIFKKHGCPGFRFRPIYGIGLNQKGFVQTGKMSDGSATLYSYTRTYRRTYTSLYLGFSYYFVYTKKIKADLGFLLNPDLDIRKIAQNDSYFRPVTLGSRSFIAIDYALSETLSLRLSPYFQYALMNYYMWLRNTLCTDYKPYGFGLNVGLAF